MNPRVPEVLEDRKREVKGISITNPEFNDGPPNTLTIWFKDSSYLRYKFGSAFGKDTNGWRFMQFISKRIKLDD